MKEKAKDLRFGELRRRRRRMAMDQNVWIG
jgi:hypothetical protein